jgi:ATPase subunit of ABC transporter with duplicated ATPase domains
MLQVQNLRKSYGSATVLADISFVINDNEHVGLVSPNGAGKTTLLRCIIGQEAPDGGAIILSPPRQSIGYLPQSFVERADSTVGAVIASAQAELLVAAEALQHAADALAVAEDMQSALAAYDAAFARFEALGGYEREHRAAAVLQGLGLGDVAAETPVALLSGGQKTRLGLAILLLSAPDLLLLDEPTNHLDVEALEWLERFVQSYPGAALIVSHDREFLDRTATRILYLDPTTHTLKSYTGNYSDFAEAREHERELHVETWKKQQDYIAQVESDIARLKGQALGVELTTTPSQPHVRRVAKKVAKKARSRERKLERYRESDERVEKPHQSWGLKLDFGSPPASGRAVLRLEEVSFRYGEIRDWRFEIEKASAQSSISNLQSRMLLQDITFDIAYGERVALVGPNDAGKTTLLRLIAGQLEPLSGLIRLGANVRLGLMAQEQVSMTIICSRRCRD